MAADDTPFDRWFVQINVPNAMTATTLRANYKAHIRPVGGSGRVVAMKDRPASLSLLFTVTHNTSDVNLASPEAVKRLFSGLDASLIQVEPDRPVHKVGMTVAGNWGLDRLDQMTLPLDGLVFRDPLGQGQGQHIYIVDTGIAPHVAFQQRPVQYDYTAYADAYGSTDCEGHGTHVAGLAAGLPYGVASQATLHSIRVLDCMGAAYMSTIVAGLQYIYSYGEPQCVVSMSLGSPYYSGALRTVLQQLIVGKQCTIVVAAGNDWGMDACYTYPAGFPEVITVSATDATDAVAEYANIGSCVDLYAPGDVLQSASNKGTTQTAVMSGTSMATPLVAGVVALILQQQQQPSPHLLLLRDFVRRSERDGRLDLFLNWTALRLLQHVSQSPPTVMGAHPLPPPPPPPPMWTRLSSDATRTTPTNTPLAALFLLSPLDNMFASLLIMVLWMTCV